VAAIARTEVERFLRFAVVGGTGFLIDVGVLALMHNGAGLDPFSARLISISVAAFSTWRLNRIVTFGASPSGQASEGLRYAAVAALAAGLNYFSYALALILWRELPPVAAAVMATLVAMTFSYFGYSRFAFQGSTATVLSVSPRSQRRWPPRRSAMSKWKCTACAESERGPSTVVK
jgi:putative flippase GtrA